MPNLIINNICNQRCKYCFAEDSMFKEVLPVRQQKLSTYLEILRFLRAKWYDEVRYLWGEPLLHHSLETMIAIAHRWWFQTLLFSNLNFPQTYVQSKFKNPLSFPHRINANINNRDFYSDKEYLQVYENLQFFQKNGVDLTLGYNVYDLEKPFWDMVDLARNIGIKRINLKVTNTIIGDSLIIDTGTREYGTYLYNIISKYAWEFDFVFWCGLSPNIFLSEEIKTMEGYGIKFRYGCDGFTWKFDIDIDGSIYKCFPTRNLYLKKGISIYNFPSEDALFAVGWIQKSQDVCAAHTFLKS